MNDEQSSFIHTSSLSGTDPDSHLHNHFPFLLNCWWSSSSRKLGFILFIVPIHTRWRDSASISSTLSNFLFKNKKKQTRIFSFARRADATPLLCYDRCQKRLIFIHHVVKIADPWNKKKFHQCLWKDGSKQGAEQHSPHTCCPAVTQHFMRLKQLVSSWLLFIIILFPFVWLYYSFRSNFCKTV